MAHALVTRGSWDLKTPYSEAFLSMIGKQAAELNAMGLPNASARDALLQMYAQPVFNAQRAGASGP
jgi:hypothetical protein